MRFEIRLANGKSLATDSSFELAMFYETNGECIAPAPQKKGKKNRKNKGGTNPTKVG